MYKNKIRNKNVFEVLKIVKNVKYVRTQNNTKWEGGIK